MSVAPGGVHVVHVRLVPRAAAVQPFEAQFADESEAWVGDGLGAGRPKTPFFPLPSLPAC
jgi:hypothetical protein